MPIPKNASSLVKEAYTTGIARIRNGLTHRDIRQLQSAVKRGELRYIQNYNVPGH